MKRKVLTIFCAIMVIVLFSIPAIAQEDIYKGNPYYLVMVKVQEAADYLAKHGEEGLAEFNKKDGKFTWGKGKYVFVYNCEAGVIAAHPSPARIGGKLSTRVDGKGYFFCLDLCKVANKPKGGWVEYYRRTDSADKTKGGEEFKRKISYMLKVPGQPYEVGAGMYEPNKTVDELNKLLQKVKFF
jgi:cytochrome c